MRELRLQDCEIVVISIAKEERRREAAAALCARLGLPYRFLNGIVCSPGIIGCGLSHLRALRAWNGERPLLVLEDDIAETDDYKDCFQIPDDADSFYIGTSVWGLIECLGNLSCSNSVIAEPRGDGIVRIYNMLTSHAIVHLSKRWRDGVIDGAIKAMVDDNRPFDIGMARIQRHFNVYASGRPIFYQSAALQRPGKEAQEADTLAPVAIGPVGTILDVSVGKSVRLSQEVNGPNWVLA